MEIKGKGKKSGIASLFGVVLVHFFFKGHGIFSPIPWATRPHSSPSDP